MVTRTNSEGVSPQQAQMAKKKKKEDIGFNICKIKTKKRKHLALDTV